MFCPYAVNRKIVRSTKMEYDDDGRQTSYIEGENNTADFLKCPQEECGAWQDGKCCYNSKSE